MGRRAVPPRHGATDRRWDGSRRSDATPLIDVTAVQSAIALTGQARLALGAEGAPPLDGIPDIRPVLGARRHRGQRCSTAPSWRC